MEGCLSGVWRHVAQAEEGISHMERLEEESEFPPGGPQGAHKGLRAGQCPCQAVPG